MANRDIAAARAYHNATKHSYSSVRASGHRLDWDNRPLPFKVYPHLEAIRLPQEFPPLRLPALEAIARLEAERATAIPDLSGLAQLLYLSAGITRRRRYPGGEIYFRAASHTGAMYAIELYAVCGDLPGLPAGVYHFGPGDFALRRLRAGDWRDVLAQASGGEAATAHAPVVIVSTGTYWRNAWKYQSRTYRHFGWDNGTLLANLLAAATASDWPARVVLGFADEPVNALLGLDTEREVALSLVPVGYLEAPAPEITASLPPIAHETVPLSKREVDYPAMREMHAATVLRTGAQAAAWRAAPAPQAITAPPQAGTASSGAAHPLAPPDEVPAPHDGIHQVILRRGSTRSFATRPISLAQLSTVLRAATQGVPADFLDPPHALLNDVYLIAHAVEGLPSGAYVLQRDTWVLQPLKAGAFRAEAGYLGLEQQLPADASVAIYYLADLEAICERFGNRGYRAVQLEAGILGGKVYLAAYAQHLGATGLTFYDDDVIDFFAPHAAGKSAIFHMAVGRSAQRTAD